MAGLCFGRVPQIVGDYGTVDTSRVDWEACGNSRRRMKTAVRPLGPGLYVPAVHRVCPHNEVAALMLRSFGSLPDQVHQPLGEPVARVFRDLRAHARRYGQSPWSVDTTALSYDGALRRRYLDAARSLREDGGIVFGDAFLRAFLKADKLSKPGAKPRLIYPRSPRYNLALARYLKPFEQWLWGTLDARVLTNGGVGRVVAKGLNPVRRANLIKRKFDSFKRCVCFEVDGKAFEAHVGLPQVLAEHAVYKAAYPRNSGLAKLLRYQERLVGVTSCGARFSRPGARASGDYNTGMGNSLVMLSVVVAVLRSFGCRFDFLCDGDNAVVFLEQEDAGAVVASFAERALAWSGQELVLEEPVTRLEAVRFGRSAPVWVGGRWTMVRPWQSVVSACTSSHRWLNEPRFALHWLRAVGLCELSLARGVPVLQAFASSLVSLTTGYDASRALRSGALRDYFVVGAYLDEDLGTAPITTEARVSFERAFGLSPSEQVALEGRFARLSFASCFPAFSRNSLGFLSVDPESPSAWWEHPYVRPWWDV